MTAIAIIAFAFVAFLIITGEIGVFRDLFNKPAAVDGPALLEIIVILAIIALIVVLALIAIECGAA